MKELIQKWLDDGKDFSTGVLLLNQVCKNRLLVTTIQKSPERYAEKLEYELCKAAGIVQQATAHQIPTKDASLPKPNAFLPLPAPVAKTADAGSDVAPAHDPAVASPVPAIELPADILKIKDEYSSIYNLRSQQHNILADVPQDNAPHNVKQRKVLAETIKQMSNRLELLYAAKEKYFEDGTMPDMSVLFAAPAPAVDANKELPEDVATLKKMKKNLQISVHKLGNQLEYQTEHKQKRLNPMPAGPKRLDTELTIKEKLKQIENIEFKLVELAH